MQKSKQKKQTISAQQPDVLQPQTGATPISPRYDPTGKMEQRDVVGSKDGWSEYTLDDGSIIRTKAVILDVKRAVNQYSFDGNPLYILQCAFVNQVRAPDLLRKKG
jgi:hypothetical protein